MNPRYALAALVVFSGITLGCSKTDAPSGSAAAKAPAPPTARVESPHYALELKPGGPCKVGADCVATVELDARGGYHVNQEFPYRFTAGPAKTLQYLGRDPVAPGVFSKASGDYSAPSEGHATMTVRFRPTAAGAAEVGGSYKFSVCSEQNCQVETAELVAALDAQP
ncbi:MAG TPA: hypothetical protein PLR99_30810 [Polyangiaceae bacterium]|nr:hypothetical protein [Polyangiaceae bacterium]